MATTPKSADSAVTVDSTGGDIYEFETTLNQPGGVSAFKVKVEPSAANAALVRIPALHGDEFMPIGIGSEETFSAGAGEIEQVIAKGDGGDTILSWGVVSIR